MAAIQKLDKIGKAIIIKIIKQKIKELKKSMSF